MTPARPTDPWWSNAVTYQIYPRSFLDTTGDGVGDLEGVRQRLPYIAELGVDAIWLSPIFPSPMADHGYDVADYCDIDPMFGSLAGFDRLLADAHALGLRVLLDWVPNHTSEEHPWFVESRSSRDNPKRDWYVWVDGTPDQVPTDWTAAFPAGPAWKWDDATDAWYLHRFTPEQPDLNWENPEVEAAMLDTLRFWLDRGVDGFRMDVIHFVGTRRSRIAPGYDSPTEPADTHAILRRIRSLIDGYDGDRMAVGEVYILNTNQVAEYLGSAAGPELHLAFNFVPQWTAWEAPAFRKQIEFAESAFGPLPPTWVLSNHDLTRHRSRYGRLGAAQAAAVLLLGLRGAPFLYAGEELGLEDAVVPPEQVQDPGGYRDGCRGPIPWDETPTHGWLREDNWLPFPPDHPEERAATLDLYKRLLAIRRRSDALRTGTVELLAEDPSVVAWRRVAAGDERTVLINFTDAPATYAAEGTVELSTAGRTGPYDGTLAPDEAVILHPA